MWIVAVRLALPATIFLSGPIGAEPYVPARDDEVLETVRPTQDREAQRLKAHLVTDPDNLTAAVRLARRYIEQGRAEADPRFFGYAEAVLKPWFKASTPPAEIWVLRATLRQARHDFSGALADLERALRANPTNAQAWLTRATIQQVRGDYAEARKSCGVLANLTDPLVTTTCLAGVISLMGQGEEGIRLLEQALAKAPQADPGVRAWVLGLLAEIQARLGRFEAAEQAFKAALVIDPGDPYLLAAYADTLLERGQFRAVVALLVDKTRIDALLLRLARAEQALAEQGTVQPGLKAHIQALDDRFAAARQRGDAVHLREAAMFDLYLAHRPRQALATALENWQTQREPADARLVLEAARAAGQPLAAHPVLDWLAAHQLEDQRLKSLTADLENGAS